MKRDGVWLILEKEKTTHTTKNKKEKKLKETEFNLKHTQTHKLFD